MGQLTLFDYTALPPDVAGEARAAAERIKVRMKRTAEDIIEIGRDLKATKERLEHGQFQGWISAEFEMSYETASRIMRVSDRFKSVNLTDLKPSVLYALSAPSVPTEVVEVATEKAHAGENVTVKDVQALKQCAEDWQNQWKNVRDKHRAAEGEISILKQEIARLLNRPTEKETVEVVRELVPAGFASVAEAIAAKQRELAQQSAEVSRLAKEKQGLAAEIGRLKNAEADRQNALSALQAKKSRLVGFRNALKKMLQESMDAQLMAATPVMDDSVAAEIEQIEKLLRDLADRIACIRSPQHFDDESARPVLVGQLMRGGRA